MGCWCVAKVRSFGSVWSPVVAAARVFSVEEIVLGWWRSEGMVVGFGKIAWPQLAPVAEKAKSVEVHKSVPLSPQQSGGGSGSLSAAALSLPA